MIELKNKDEIDKEKWDNLVKERGTKIEQFSKYSEFVEEEGWETKYLIKEGYKAGIVLHNKNGKISLIKALPPIGNNKDDLELLDSLREYLKKNAKFYNYILPDRYVLVLENIEKGYFKCKFSTIVVELKDDIETIKSHFDKDARWGIKKAQKEGAEIIEAHSQKDVEDFYEVYLETCKRGGFNPVSKKFLMSLFKYFREYNKLFLVKYKNKIIAGAWIKMCGPGFQIPKLEYNASLTEFLNIQPNNLLYFYMIDWAKKNNFSEIDLGGVEPEAQKNSKFAQLNKYKERWGGKQRDYYIYTTSFAYYKYLISSKKGGLISRFAKSLIRL
jgi:hypothetical protein